MYLKSTGTVISFYLLTSLLYSTDTFFLLFSHAPSLGVALLFAWHIGAYLSRLFVSYFFTQITGHGKIVLITGKAEI